MKEVKTYRRNLIDIANASSRPWRHDACRTVGNVFFRNDCRYPMRASLLDYNHTTKVKIDTSKTEILTQV